MFRKKTQNVFKGDFYQSDGHQDFCALSRTGILDLSCMRQSALCEPSMSLQFSLWEASNWHLHCQSEVSGSELGESSICVSSDMVTVTGPSIHPTFLWLLFFFLTAVSWDNSVFLVKSQALSWLVFVPDLCLQVAGCVWGKKNQKFLFHRYSYCV